MALYKKNIKSTKGKTIKLGLYLNESSILDVKFGELRVSYGTDSLSKITDYQDFLCTFNASPFGNCQSWSIGSFNTLTAILDQDVEDQTLLSIIVWINNLLNDKNLLLLDLDKNYIKKATKLFDKAVIDTHKYKSTNNNIMTMFFIEMSTVEELAAKEKKNIFKT